MKRYRDWEQCGDVDISTDLFEHPNSEWVKYEDVQNRITALVKENEALRNLIGDHIDRMNDLYVLSMPDEIKESLAKLKEACDNGIEGGSDV